MTTRDHSPHRQMNALRLPLCTLLCLWGGASSAVTQSATLEACSSAAGTGLTATICSNRLALDVPVRNGQNETEPVTVAVDSVIDCTSGGGGACTATTLENKVRITLTRTPVYFKYTTAYHSTVNYQKYELAVRMTSLCFVLTLPARRSLTHTDLEAASVADFLFGMLVDNGADRFVG